MYPDRRKLLDSERPRKARLLNGEGGIRTPGDAYTPQQISNLPLSTTQPPLQVGLTYHSRLLQSANPLGGFF
jgi:hypothetical protein